MSHKFRPGTLWAWYSYRDVDCTEKKIEEKLSITKAMNVFPSSQSQFFVHLNEKKRKKNVKLIISILKLSSYLIQNVIASNFHRNHIQYNVESTIKTEPKKTDRRKLFFCQIRVLSCDAIL